MVRWVRIDLPTHLLPDAPVLTARFGLIPGWADGVDCEKLTAAPEFDGADRGAVELAEPEAAAVCADARPVRAAAVRAARGNRPVAPARVPGGLLPRGREWLVKELGCEAVAYTSQLTALRDEPAMQAALAAMPGLARVLRPLCRMLGVERRALPETSVAVRRTLGAVITLASPPERWRYRLVRR